MKPKTLVLIMCLTSMYTIQLLQANSQEANSSDVNDDDSDDSDNKPSDNKDSDKPDSASSDKENEEKETEESSNEIGDEFCFRVQNDLPAFTPQVTNLLTTFKQALTPVKGTPRGALRADLFDYRIFSNVRYDDFIKRCQGANLRHVTLDTDEEIDLMRLIVNDMHPDKAASKSPDKPDKVWFMGRRGVGKDNTLYSYAGTVTDASPADSTHKFKFIDADETSNCASLVLENGDFLIKQRVCTLTTYGICLRRRDFSTSISERLFPSKALLLEKINKVLPDQSRVKKYLTSIQSSSCSSTPIPSEKASEALKRTYSVLRETLDNSQIPMTKVFSQLDRFWDFLLDLEGFVGGDDQHISKWIRKILMNSFLDVNTSLDESVLCLCPPNKLLFKLKDYLAKVPQFEGILDFIEIESRVRITELVLTLLTALALIVAFVGLGLQRRQMTLKERRHQERERRRRVQAGIENEDDIEAIEQEESKPKKRVNFLMMKSNKKGKNPRTPSPLPSSSSSESSSNDSLNSRTLIPTLT